MAPQKVLQLFQAGEGTISTQVKNQVMALTRSKIGKPGKQQNQTDDAGTYQRGGKFLGTAGHADDDERQDIHRIECIPENITEPYNRKDSKQAEGSNDVVIQNHHHKGNRDRKDDKGAYKVSGVGKSRMGKHIDPGEQLPAQEGQQDRK